jgi:hypothetical protein
MRVRSRRAPDRRHDWPLTVEAELAAGVDLAPFAGRRMALLFARWARERPWDAQAVADLTMARELLDGVHDVRP